MLIVLLLAALFRAMAHAAPQIDAEKPSSAAEACQQFRTLQSIIWSCLLTVFACTWTAIHPNLPGPDEGKLRILWTRIKIVILALVAPEYILLWAIQQRTAAKKIVAEAHKEGFGYWTDSHGFFVTMGGFVLENEGTPVHAVIPGQYDMKFTDFEFPHITEKQIQDRSKGDALSKAIVLGQLGWFLIQCITRGAERLPVTELELVTAAYAVLTTFIYIAWWSKPKDISCYTPVSRSNTGKDKIFSGWGFHTFLENFLSILLCHPNLERSPKVPSLFSGSDDMGSRDHLIGLVCQCAAGAIFGAIHCIAWNFTFNHLERILWRISSAVVAGYPALVLIYLLTGAIFAGGFNLEDYPEFLNILQIPIVFLGPPSYVASRIILLALPLAALRHLPEGAYRVVQWSTFIPHIG